MVWLLIWRKGWFMYPFRHFVIRTPALFDLKSYILSQTTLTELIHFENFELNGVPEVGLLFGIRKRFLKKLIISCVH